MAQGDAPGHGFPRFVPADLKAYLAQYQRSIDDREGYWRDRAGRIQWETPFEQVIEEDFATASFASFAGGRLNPAVNALDRHVEADRRESVAFRFVAADKTVTAWTFEELLARVVQTGSTLAAAGVAAGDRVALYLPDCPETVFAMLACARIGAVYVPIPAQFTAEIAAEIVADCGSSMLITAAAGEDASLDDRIRQLVEWMENVTVVTVGDKPLPGTVTFEEFLTRGSVTDTVTIRDAGDPLFIIYANSAAGIPRGSVFAAGGYLVQTADSFDSIFQSVEGVEPARNVACTRQLASTAGQTYGLWGPLLNGIGLVLTARGDTPGFGTLSTVLDTAPGSALLTSPHLLGILKRDEGSLGDRRFIMVAVTGDILSPRIVSFAGDALTTGAERVVNMWIQSESGAAVITAYPTQSLNRPGALGLPAPGMKPVAVNYAGEPCRTNESGQLVVAGSWPAMIRTIWGQRDRFRELYFQRRPGTFATNDGVRQDGDEFFWFMGRLDDVIKIRGQSLATSEIEAVLVTNARVAEAAVVALSGAETENLTAFIVLDRNVPEPETTEDCARLEGELSASVAGRIGEFAIPNDYIFSRELPRTRTGKVVRRVLRRIATGDISRDEDLSHIANPHAVDELIRKRGS